MGVKQLLDLSGKVVLVTGGSRGLGLQMAEALGEMGAQLAISARKQNELDEAQQHLQQQGVEVLTVAADVGDFESIPRLVDAVMARYGRIDVLVNNAGATWGAPAEQHPLDKWQKVFDVNLTGLFRLTQEVANRSMLPRGGGRIVNIASIAGIVGQLPELMQALAYSTSKGGVISFTRALAAEWGPKGITVNAICPGFFPSKMAQKLIERGHDKLVELTPRGVLGGDEDLKGLVVLLASEASRHITGQIIAVDGGTTIV